ncbi:MAG TPA: amidase [Rubrivivax sp.]|nr:amidase [Rubrivivax sp.]
MPITLQELEQDLAAGRTSALALAEAALARAEDPAGEGARVFTRLYRERALAMARASDTLRAAGIVRSPLEGIPVSIKDLFDVAGEVTLAGSVVRRKQPPATRNATIVDRLIAAGAVIVGRTNMVELAFSGLGLNPHYGTPRNPWGRGSDGSGRIPGGSSSGSAVSVSDGMCAVAIGTDTGGSVRIPSALCGLTGFKPTARRVPMEGTLPLSRALDSIGPLAASVRCCTLVDAILAGETPQPLVPAELDGARLAIPEDVVLDAMDEHVARSFDAACARLSQQGARIGRVRIPALAQLPQLHARGTLATAEAWAANRALVETNAGDYDPRVLSRMRPGATMGAADLLDLQAARQRWIAEVSACIEGVDALLMPTVPIVAPPIAPLQADDALYAQTNALVLRNPTFINFLDGCAISLPCHEPGSAPVGLMLAAAGGHDARILALGLAVETALAAAR